jgi:PAS domain S-box-containing protein
MIGSTGDITELKRVERALKASEERYALATRAATEGIYEWNLETGSLYLSDRAKAFFAVSGEALTPAAWNARVHGEDLQRYRDAIAAYLKGTSAQFEHEYRIGNASGGYSWVLDRAVAVRDARGRATRLVGALSDVTPRKLAEIELRRARDEATEALERQTASADILRVISSTPTDTQPVFDAIVESARRLLGGKSAILLLRRETDFFVAGYSAPGLEELPREVRTPPLDREKNFPSRVMLDGEVLHIPDWQGEDVMEFERFVAKSYGIGSGVQVPLLRKGHGIGALIVARASKGPFHEKEIALLRSFADQAVIAIENTRLFNETKEALERQTATAEILKVISTSTTAVQPVFDTIIRNAVRLCEGAFGVLFRYDGEVMDIGALHNIDGPAEALFRRAYPQLPNRDNPGGRAIVDAAIVNVGDVQQSDFSDEAKARARATGYSSGLAVPMMRDGIPLGSIAVAKREAGKATQAEVDLLTTFAAQAVIAIENVRLFNETKEALDRQTATADILRVISSTPADVQPVFEAIVRTAYRLFACSRTAVLLRQGDRFTSVANFDGAELSATGIAIGLPIDPAANFPSRVFVQKRLLHLPDWSAIELSAHEKRMQVERNVKSSLMVPLLREDDCIGVLAFLRSEQAPFDDKQIALAQSFASQAVIAIENTRLFRELEARNSELTTALDQQTATSDILRVISRSTEDAQPVFEAIAESSMKLLHGWSVIIWRLEDGRLRPVAFSGGLPGSNEAVRNLFATLRADDIPFLIDAMRAGKSRQILDAEAEDVLPIIRDAARVRGWRSNVAVPMLQGGKPIGAITLSRVEPGGFTQKEVALLETFADQAVIAIENVRLFNETKESLERQTATAEILKVIASSPSDVQPVFNAIVEAARRLINGFSCVVRLLEGDLLRIVALTSTSNSADEEFRTRRQVLPVSTEKLWAQVVRDRAPAFIADTEKDTHVTPEFLELARLRGYRSVLTVPMLREGDVIGTISVSRREPGAFTGKEITLLQTFADQAVIAIENVRLFNETKEALEQQTAISEVLRVISASPADVKPVLDAVAQRAAKICEANDARIWLVDGKDMRLSAGCGDVPVHFELFPLNRATASGRAVIDRMPVQIEDINIVSDEEFAQSRENARKSGWRTILSVPLMREKRALGAIALRRSEVRPFSEKQIALLNTFADQAAIAIENVRLFKETQESLERQTATAEVLKTISRSTFELERVLQALLDNAARLGGARQALMLRPDAAGNYLPTISFNWSPEVVARLRERPIRAGRDSTNGRVLLEKRPIHIPDVRKDAEYGRQDLVELGGFRSVLSVPMLRDGEAIGMITLTSVEPFTEKQIEVVTTFADQAVIAIENVRMFRELEEKSRQLEQASKHKSQFLASMSHELRTPLNAILGFNEMLIGGIYGDPPADMLEPLKDIQTSGKHLLRLINNVLDLAKIEAGRMELALADYSVQDTVAGVQATLRPLAAEKGLEFVAQVPADIPLARGDSGRLTQCLMNLAGNSLKFTKSGKVEIAVVQRDGLLRYRVSDTGIGIPPDKIASLFTEFKQTDATIASEFGGTGLGLSISKKFIEMHGGRIWVESELGKGSSFIFEVPLRATA